MGQVVEASKLMRHGMHIAQACTVEGHPSKELSITAAKSSIILT